MEALVSWLERVLFTPMDIRQSKNALRLRPDCTPERRFVREANVTKSRIQQHLLDLISSKSLLESGAESIIRIGTHDIKIPIAVGGERN